MDHSQGMKREVWSGQAMGVMEKQPSTQGPGPPPAVGAHAPRSLCTEPLNTGPHLQLASRRTPIHPPILTWSWRPTLAWREDPRPARGEGWAGTEGEKSCQAN